MLEKLSEVQNLDLELDNLQEEKGRTPPELISTREERDQLAARLSAVRQERDALHKRVRDSELELQALADRRKAAADAGLRAESSKEASQYQNQELQFATRVQELEEDTMPLMEELEGLDAQVAELEEQLAQVEPQLQEQTQQENERVAGLEEQISSLEGQRSEMAQAVDKQLLRVYEQVRKSKRGLGLVDVVNNQQCGGCSMRLPIHVVQKARRGKGITRCPSCGRILWAKE